MATPLAIAGAFAVASARSDGNNPPSVIVADISNDSGSPAADHLAFALPELLVTNLGEYPRGPLVRARGTKRLSDGPEDAVILSGRLVRDGEGFAAFVSLRQAQDGRILWTDRYPIADANIASAARQIAGRAAAALGSQLRLPPSREMPSGAAHALYWEGRRLAETREEAGLAAARTKLIAALQLSPNFGAAHSALANIYAHKSGEHLGVPRLDTFEEAENHAAIAEQLSGRSAETAITRALLAVFRDRDLDAALARSQEAVRLDDGNADAWQSLAMVSSIRGDDRTALKAINQAVAIEPSRIDLQSDRVWMLYAAGRTAQAANAAARIPGGGSIMALYRALIAARQGDRAGAFAQWAERARLRGLDSRSVEAAVRQSSIDLSGAYRSLAAAVSTTDAYDENEVALAAMYRGGGDREQAARTLQGVRRTRDSWLWLWLDRLPELRGA